MIIGTIAPTVQRSRYGANTRALARFTARHNEDDKLLVGHFEVPEAHRRIEDREVDAELVEALVEQRGKVRGRTVAQVVGLPSPPRRHRPPLFPHGHVAAVRERRRGVEGARRARQEAVAERRAAGLLEIRDDLVVEERTDLHEMTVGIDDRMADLPRELPRHEYRLPSSPSPSLTADFNFPRMSAPLRVQHRARGMRRGHLDSVRRSLRPVPVPLATASRW